MNYSWILKKKNDFPDIFFQGRAPISSIFFVDPAVSIFIIYL